MPPQKDLAIIIRTQDLGEADRLVTCLSQQAGRLRLLAKNARRSQRRFANCLEPLSLVRIYYTLKPQQELGRLDRGELVTNFRPLRQHLEALAAAAALGEIAEALGGAVDHVAAIFHLLSQALQDLSSGQEPASLFCSHLVHLLALAGYGLDWETCRQCRRQAVGLAWFSLAAAGVICAACVAGQDKERLWPLHAGTRKLLAAAQSLPLTRLSRLHYSKLAAREAINVLHRFVSHLLGHELKALEFFVRWRQQLEK